MSAGRYKEVIVNDWTLQQLSVSSNISQRTCHVVCAVSVSTLPRNASSRVLIHAFNSFNGFPDDGASSSPSRSALLPPYLRHPQLLLLLLLLLLRLLPCAAASCAYRSVLPSPAMSHSAVTPHCQFVVRWLPSAVRPCLHVKHRRQDLWSKNCLNVSEVITCKIKYLQKTF